MALEGWQFAAELSQLRVVGRVDLPALGYTYTAMNQAVDGTRSQEQAAFAAPGGSTSVAYGIWSSVRDDLQNILGQTANAMHAAGVTIEHIVDAYATADTSAAASLKTAWDNGQTPDLTAAETTFRTETPAVVLKDQP
jgi:hypothetical protein